MLSLAFLLIARTSMRARARARAGYAVVILMFLPFSVSQPQYFPVQVPTLALTSAPIPTQTQTRRVIVQCKAFQREACQDQLASRLGTRHYDFEEFNVFVVSISENDVQELEQSAEIHSIHEDVPRYTHTHTHTQTHHKSQNSTQNTESNNDFNYRYMMNYGIAMVQSQQAWSYGITGRDVKVCIIDTGVDETHPELINRVQGFNPLSLPWNIDGIGHGTHVAGIVGSVAPDAQLLSVKAFADDGTYAFSSDIAAAALACAEQGATILSMSIGSSQPNAFEARVLHSLLMDHGIISVASSAGGGHGSFPASYPSVISVTALDSNKQLAQFAPFDKHTNVAAPGQGIWSTLPLHDPCVICSVIGAYQYGELSGTSMAVPHVSGVLALMQSFQPLATAQEIIDALYSSGDPASGLVQALAAVEVLNGGPLVRDHTSDWSTLLPSLTCALDHIVLQLDIDTTNAEGDAYWEVHRFVSGELIFSGNLFPDTPTSTEERCVPDECLVLTYTNGTFNVTLDGQVVIHSEAVYSTKVNQVMGRTCPGSSPNDHDAEPPTKHDIFDVQSVGEGGNRCRIAGQVPFELVIKTDSHPEETSIQLRRVTDKALVWTHSNLQAKQKFAFDACLDQTECYVLTIRDSGGDGLCCTYGLGGYQTFYDNKEVQKGAIFKELVTIELGDCSEGKE